MTTKLFRNKLLRKTLSTWCAFATLATTTSPVFAVTTVLNSELNDKSANVNDIAIDGTTATFSLNSGSVGVLDWNSYTLNAGDVFDYKGADATWWNLVNASAGKSVIDGTINGQGNVFVLNPNGFAFGAGSVVNVGGIFAAAAMGMGTENVSAFVAAEDPSVFDLSGKFVTGTGDITVDAAASITAGDITLAGNGVTLEGTANGPVTIMSGNALVVDSIGGGNVSVTFDLGESAAGDVSLMGTFTDNLTAKAAGTVTVKDDITASGKNVSLTGVNWFQTAGKKITADKVSIETKNDVALDKVEATTSLKVTTAGDITQNASSGITTALVDLEATGDVKLDDAANAITAVKGSANDLTIVNTLSTTTVSDDLTVNSLTAGSITQTAGTLTAGTITADVTQNGGTITSTGDLTVNGVVNQTAGTIAAASTKKLTFTGTVAQNEADEKTAVIGAETAEDRGDVVFGGALTQTKGAIYAKGMTVGAAGSTMKGTADAETITGIDKLTIDGDATLALTEVDDNFVKEGDYTLKAKTVGDSFSMTAGTLEAKDASGITFGDGYSQTGGKVESTSVTFDGDATQTAGAVVADSLVLNDATEASTVTLSSTDNEIKEVGGKAGSLTLVTKTDLAVGAGGLETAGDASLTAKDGTTAKDITFNGDVTVGAGGTPGTLNLDGRDVTQAASTVVTAAVLDLPADDVTLTGTGNKISKITGSAKNVSLNTKVDITVENLAVSTGDGEGLMKIRANDGTNGKDITLSNTGSNVNSARTIELDGSSVKQTGGTVKAETIDTTSGYELVGGDLKALATTSDLTVKGDITQSNGNINDMATLKVTGTFTQENGTATLAAIDGNVVQDVTAGGTATIVGNGGTLTKDITFKNGNVTQDFSGSAPGTAKVQGNIVLSNAGTVDLQSTANAVNSLSGTASDVNLYTATAIDLGALKLVNLELAANDGSAAQDVTQSGVLEAGTVKITDAGSVTLGKDNVIGKADITVVNNLTLNQDSDVDLKVKPGTGTTTVTVKAPTTENITVESVGDLTLASVAAKDVTLNGSGDITVSTSLTANNNATVDAAGNVAVSGANVTGETNLKSTGATGTVTLSGNNTFNDTVTLTANGAVQQTGGTTKAEEIVTDDYQLAGDLESLTGTGDVTVKGNLTQTGGNVQNIGTLTVTDTLTQNGGSVNVTTIKGDVTQKKGAITATTIDGNVLQQVTGTDTATIGSSSSPITFQNGNIEQDLTGITTGGKAIIQGTVVTLTNAGTVDAQSADNAIAQLTGDASSAKVATSGAINLDALAIDGNLDVAAGGNVTVTGANTFNGTAKLGTTSGTIEQTGGTTKANMIEADYTLSGATTTLESLTGSGDVTVKGNLNQNGGAVQNINNLTVTDTFTQNNGTLTLKTGAGAGTLKATVVQNETGSSSSAIDATAIEGSVTQNGGDITAASIAGNVTQNNVGTANIIGKGTPKAITFKNGDVVQNTTGSGTAKVDAEVTLDNAGTVDLQSSANDVAKLGGNATSVKLATIRDLELQNLTVTDLSLKANDTVTPTGMKDVTQAGGTKLTLGNLSIKQAKDVTLENNNNKIGNTEVTAASLKLKQDNDINLTADISGTAGNRVKVQDSATESVTINSDAGSGNDLVLDEVTGKNVTIDGDKDVIISALNAGGIVGTTKVGGEVSVTGAGDVSVKDLTAYDSVILKSTGGSVGLTKGTSLANNALDKSLKVEAATAATVEETVVTAGGAKVDAGTTATIDDVNVKAGNLDVNAVGNITLADAVKVDAGATTIRTTTGNVTQTGTAGLTFVGGDASIMADAGSITITKATVGATTPSKIENSLTVTGKNKVDISNVSVTKDLTVESLKQGVELDGTITVDGNATFYATDTTNGKIEQKTTGDLTVGKLTTMVSGGDVTVYNGTFKDDLTISGKNVTFGLAGVPTTEVKKDLNINATGNATVTDVWVNGGDADIDADGDTTITDLRVTGDYADIDAGSKATLKNVQVDAGGYLDVNAGANVELWDDIKVLGGDTTIVAGSGKIDQKLTTPPGTGKLDFDGDVIMTAGTGITLVKADVEETATITAGGDINISNTDFGILTAGSDEYNRDAAIVAGGSVTLTDVKVNNGGDADVGAGTTITFERVSIDGDATVLAVNGASTPAADAITLKGTVAVNGETDMTATKGDIVQAVDSASAAGKLNLKGDASFTAVAGSVKLDSEVNVTAGDLDVVAGTDAILKKATVTAGDLDIAAGANVELWDDVKVDSGDTTIVAGGNIDQKQTTPGTGALDLDGDVSMTAATDITIVDADVEETAVIAAGGDIAISKTDFGTLAAGSDEYNRDAAIVAGGSVTLTTVNVKNGGDATVDATTTAALNTVDVTGDASVDAKTGVTLTGTNKVGGDADIETVTGGITQTGTLAVTGDASLTTTDPLKASNINMASVTANNLDADAQGDVKIDYASVTVDMDVDATGTATIGTASGTTTTVGGSATVDSVGNATLDNVTVTTGDLTVNATATTSDAKLTTVTVTAGDAAVTAGKDVTLDAVTVTAGDLDATASNGSVTLQNTVKVGGDANITATETAAATVANINQASGKLEVTGDATLVAADDISIGLTGGNYIDGQLDATAGNDVDLDVIHTLNVDNITATAGSIDVDVTAVAGTPADFIMTRTTGKVEAKTASQTIDITTTEGDIVLTKVEANGTSGTVTLNAQTGTTAGNGNIEMYADGRTINEVTANTLNLTASGDVGATSATTGDLLTHVNNESLDVGGNVTAENDQSLNFSASPTAAGGTDTVGGALTQTVLGGNITQSATVAVDVTGVTTLVATDDGTGTSGHIILEEAANDFRSTVNLDTDDYVQIVDANNLKFDQVDVDGFLEAKSVTANIDQVPGTSKVEVDGTTHLEAATGITLDNAINDFVGAVSAANTTSGNISLRDANDIQLGDGGYTATAREDGVVNNGGDIVVATVDGDITLNNIGTATSGAGVNYSVDGANVTLTANGTAGKGNIVQPNQTIDVDLDGVAQTPAEAGLNTSVKASSDLVMLADGSVGNGEYITVEAGTVAVDAGGDASVVGIGGMDVKKTGAQTITYADTTPGMTSETYDLVGISTGGNADLYTDGQISTKASGGKLDIGGDVTVAAKSYDRTIDMTMNGDTVAVNGIHGGGDANAPLDLQGGNTHPEVTASRNGINVFIDGRYVGGERKNFNRLWTLEAFQVLMPSIDVNYTVDDEGTITETTEGEE